MSSNFINANDLDRLSRESQLTEQAPRALPQMQSTHSSGMEPSEPPQEENAGIALIIALANMLKTRGY